MKDSEHIDRIMMWFKRLICKIFGHRVMHDVIECHHPDYWSPEIDEVFWCSRCGEDL